MKKYFLYIVALIGLTFSLSSCHTSAPRLNYKALAKASVRMAVDINMEDCTLPLRSGWGSATAQVVTTSTE